MKCEVKIFISKANPIVLLTNALCVTLKQLSVNRPGGHVVKRFLPAKSSTVETNTRGQVERVKLEACCQQEIELRHFLGQTSTFKLEKDVQMPGTLKQIGICKI